MKNKKKKAAAAAAAATGPTSSPEVAADAGQREDASSPQSANPHDNPYVDYEASDGDEQQGSAGEQQEEDSSSSEEETGKPRESPAPGQAPVSPPVPASVEDLEEICYTEEVHQRILAHREGRPVEPLSEVARAFLARRQRGINVSGKRKFVSPEAGDSTEIGPRELFPPLPSTPSEPASSDAPAVPAASSSSSAIVLTDDGRATSAVQHRLLSLPPLQLQPRRLMQQPYPKIHVPLHARLRVRTLAQPPTFPSPWLISVA